MVKRLRLAAALAWLALASVGLPGCAYRMPAAAAPSLPRLRLAAQSPRQYVVRLETGGIKDYPVPADGRVTLEVPGARPRCQVYLFNWIRVGGGADPSKLWRIEARTSQFVAVIGRLPPKAQGNRYVFWCLFRGGRNRWWVGGEYRLAAYGAN